MLTITRLLWDEHNIAHIAKHAVTPAEVEEACQSRSVVLQAYGGRLALIGMTARPRILTVILNPQLYAGEYYVVTARDADKNERQWYRTYTGGGSP
ncbi:MAG: BrnT family toxin [Chloroflexota bacterium]|nr:BrnT family toxin [Chloroflexota bacterium]